MPSVNARWEKMISKFSDVTIFLSSKYLNSANDEKRTWFISF